MKLLSLKIVLFLISVGNATLLCYPETTFITSNNNNTTPFLLNTLVQASGVWLYDYVQTTSISSGLVGDYFCEELCLEDNECLATKTLAYSPNITCGFYYGSGESEATGVLRKCQNCDIRVVFICPNQLLDLTTVDFYIPVTLGKIVRQSLVRPTYVYQSGSSNSTMPTLLVDIHSLAYGTTYGPALATISDDLIPDKDKNPIVVIVAGVFMILFFVFSLVGVFLLEVSF